MKRIIALTAVGADKPGIVAGVTKVLYDLGCNLEESTMTSIRRDFAMIMLISTPDSVTIADVKDKMEPIKTLFGLSINLRKLSDEETKETVSGNTPNYILAIYGIDKPGIVYKISAILAESNINITDLQTQTSHTGEKPLYALILEVKAPDDADINALRAEIKKLCAELSVDFSLEPINACEDM